MDVNLIFRIYKGIFLRKEQGRDLKNTRKKQTKKEL